MELTDVSTESTGASKRLPSGEIASQRLDITNERLGVVESTLLTLARRQTATLKHVKATAEHVSRLDVRMTDLEARGGPR